MLNTMRAAVLVSALSALALSACVAPAETQNPDQLFRDAIDAQQRGDFPTAIREYRQVLELRPNTVEARVNLGAALAHEGQFDAAIAEYRSALPGLSEKTAVLLDLALAYYKKGDLENARDQFQPLHRAQPKNARIAILLGDTDLRLKGPAAVTMLTPLEGENSQNMDLEYVLGSALIQGGRRREGVARIEKVAASRQQRRCLYACRVDSVAINEFEPARHDLDTGLRLDPKLPGIYTLTGTARDKTGDVAGAESAFREALKLNPNDFTANLYLGAILYKRRQLEEAKTYLEKALQLNPRPPWQATKRPCSRAPGTIRRRGSGTGKGGPRGSNLAGAARGTGVAVLQAAPPQGRRQGTANCRSTDRRAAGTGSGQT